MKKIGALIPMLLLMPALSVAANVLLFSVAGIYTRPADAGYRAVYGNHALFPEYTAGVHLYKGLYVLGSYGKFTRKATIPDLNVVAQSSQSYIAAGLAYITKISGNISWDVEGAIAGMKYEEHALDAVITGKTPGYKAESGFLMMGEHGQIFVGLKAGYLFARVKDLDVKLGGFRVLLCLGVQLFGER